MLKRSEVLFQSGQKIYSLIIDNVLSMYDNIFANNCKWSKLEVRQNIEEYIISFLVKLSLLDEVLSKDEAKFISSLYSNKEIFDGIDLSYFADCNYEMRAKLLSIANKKTELVPYAIMLSGAIDKKYDKKITKGIFEGIVKLGYNLEMLSTDSPQTKDIILLAKSITDYVVKNGINMK